MEITAAIEALTNIEPQDHIKIYSDSTYLIEGMNIYSSIWVDNDWVVSIGLFSKDIPLWKELLALRNKHRLVEWFWVKGHSGDRWNTAADKKANEQAHIYLNKM
jgi:ribonuclease HI